MFKKDLQRPRILSIISRPFYQTNKMCHGSGKLKERIKCLYPPPPPPLSQSLGLEQINEFSLKFFKSVDLGKFRIEIP